MTHRSFPPRLIALLLATSLTACSGVSGDNSASTGRVSSPHIALQIVDPSGTAKPSNGSADGSATKGVTGEVTSQATAINTSLLGTMYLDSIIKTLTVDGTSLQASDVTINGGNVYVAYNAVDINGVVVKKGAVEQLTPLACDSSGSAFCTKIAGRIDFSNADIFAVHSDGTNLFAVGSTSDESAAPKFARLYKIGMNTAKTPSSLLGTTVLPSYAGTGVLSIGSNVLVTSGTSSDTSKMGGLSVVNAATMAVTASQSLYDARGIGVYKASATSNPTSAFVVRGKVSSSDLGAVVEYPVTGASATRTIATGGNSIPESKSTVQVGNQLLLVSLGDAGFKVVCKATGATLLTKAAPVVSGLATSRTVTNSVTASPGFIFAANGEAGLYVYKFAKSSAFNTNYCQGVTATLLGRLSLDSDDSDSTYVNGELSANSVYYMPVYNILNIITSKLVVVASGNKGVSFLNITGLNILSDDVDDF